MPRFTKRKGFCRAAIVWFAAAAFLVVIAGHSFAENAQAPPAAAVLPPQPAAPDKPGFFHELGRWWDGSIGYLHDKIKATPSTFEDIGKKTGDVAVGAAVATGEGMKKTFDVSKDAATTIVRLPNTRVVEVHERCATAGNGAPDCAAAATTACRGKGFSGGKPLDSRTAEVCPDVALASGKTPAKGECPLETIVLRAVCQ